MSTIQYLHIILLAILLVSNVLFVKRDVDQYEQFKLKTDSEQRIRFLRRWVIEPFFLYGVVAVVCLFLIGRQETLIRFPEELNIASDWIQARLQGDGFLHGMLNAFAYTLVPVMLFGCTCFTAILVFAEHQANVAAQESESDMSGTEASPSLSTAITDSRNLEALLPRNKDERFWTTLLSINAGLSEELFFRLLVPLLTFGATGSILAAIGLSTLWFGLLHSYQGWVGVASTTLAGALLMFAYLLTKQLWLVILIHMVIDLNGLTFGPWLAERLKKKQA